MKYIPSTGPKNARIVLVGESPGSQENRIGTPFVGPAGDVLNGILGAAGISRDECYITNSVHYMPPGGEAKDEFFFSNGKPTEVYVEGIKELYADLREIKPNVVVPMGNYALFALTGQRHISKWRGSIMQSLVRVGDNRALKIIPTLHPAYIMRVWQERLLSIWDFQRIKRESEFPEIKTPVRNLIINPTETEIAAATLELLNSELISFDIETYDADHLACVGYCCDPSWAICIPAGPEYDSYHRALLSSPVRKVCQNSMFERTVLHRLGYSINNLHDDTMIAQHVCWTGLPKDLGTLSSIYTDEPFYKDDLKVWGQVRDKDILYRYNAKDCCVTLEIWNKLEKEELPYCKGETAYKTSMGIFEIMAKATDVGIKVDRDLLSQRITELTEKEHAMTEALTALVGEPFNPGSSQQTAKIVYDMLGIKERAKRTTKQEVLMDIAAQEKDPNRQLILGTIVKIRHVRKLLSQYITEDILDRDGRVRCNWNVAGTETGRLSASQTYWGSGFSLQTSPSKRDPEFRNLFVADDGFLFIGHDLAQAEAVIVAHLTHDERLIEWMESGIDIHRKLASLLPFGLTYEQLLLMPKDCKERYLAKICRHALNYKMGPYTLQLTINKEFVYTGTGVNRREAEALHRRYLQLHPNLMQWWKQVENDLSKHSMQLTSLLGRNRKFLDRWGETMLKDAIAFVPQATVGDLTTLAITRTIAAAPDATCLIHAHDGSLLQVPEDRAEEVAKILSEQAKIPLRFGSDEFTIPVDTFIGKRYGSMEKVA
jgi:uracil-DNA glycosylase family 4